MAALPTARAVLAGDTQISALASDHITPVIAACAVWISGCELRDIVRLTPGGKLRACPAPTRVNYYTSSDQLLGM